MMDRNNTNILVVDDEKLQREILKDILSDEGYFVEVAANGREAINKFRNNFYHIVFTDLKMPDIDGLKLLAKLKTMNADTIVVLMTAYGTISNAVQAMKDGAYDYLTKPLDKDELLILIEKALETRRLSLENLELHQELEDRYCFHNIIGSSRSMQEIFKTIKKVLNNSSTVVIRGDTGTGKELVAKAIHYNSTRKNGPFVPINCAAIPENLVESELFGHEKGAFSGAINKRVGKFEQADGGTIFLDEIGSMQPGIQAKLLRVIQEMEFERVGGTQMIKVDVRVLTATNINLEKAVEAGDFREDLYHRLNVVSIKIPPLRQRREDIPLLVKEFIIKFNSKYSKNVKTITPEALDALATYEFPGNVRELENLIEKIVIFAEGETITFDDLPPNFRSSPMPGRGIHEELSPFNIPEEGIVWDDMEKTLILEALTKSKGKLGGAARLLGMTYKTLQYRIKKHNINTTTLR